MSSGIPQGSVLGPLLWNVLYDPVMRIRHEGEVEAIGFADDLAIVVTAEAKDTLVDTTNKALENINKWMTNNDLELAPEKTEAVILSGKRDRRGIQFKINDVEILPAKKIIYLGVTIGENLSFAAHVAGAAKKAGEKLTALSRIMPNIEGPMYQKRLILNQVPLSIILYGASIWSETMQVRRHREVLERAQRKALLRVASGYRTISSVALQVITGTPPIDLLVQERAHIESAENKKEAKIEAKRSTLVRWKAIWEEQTIKGQWTKKLIPDVEQWVKCQHRTLDYFLTQALTGHGSFGEYLKRIGKGEEECRYCQEVDTAEHTIFDCRRWLRERTRAEAELGEEVAINTLTALMINDKKKWKAGQRMLQDIMRQKEKEEREHQGQRDI